MKGEILEIMMDKSCIGLKITDRDRQTCFHAICLLSPKTVAVNWTKDLHFYGFLKLCKINCKVCLELLSWLASRKELQQLCTTCCLPAPWELWASLVAAAVTKHATKAVCSRKGLKLCITLIEAVLHSVILRCILFCVGKMVFAFHLH